ncbi:hypothetical protein SAMN02910292_00865 [Lachnospiraceae bacterium XBB2008]|nr:hypothetical protein SAMN02910292_00865 [Lachnospiraceae bacterium XBB2008]
MDSIAGLYEEKIHELKELISSGEAFYVFGAGKYGVKLFSLLNRLDCLDAFQGFIVSDLTGNPDSIEGYKVYEVSDKSLRRSCVVLLSVSDRYQETIKRILFEQAFTTVVDALKFAYLETDDGEITRDVYIDTREIMCAQYRDGEFNRYDILLKLYAIDSYLGHNTFGAEWYRRAQNNRVEAGYGDAAEKRFQKLIKSFSENGYDYTSEIIVDRELNLFDGAHRLSLALYYGIPRVHVRIMDEVKDVKYGREWFEEFFTEQECLLLDEKLSLISKNWFRPIKGFLWSPVSEYYDDIIKEISNQYDVENIDIRNLSYDVFSRTIKGIYSKDSVAEWKIEAKLKRLKESAPYSICSFDILMGNPDFRVKDSGSTLSKKGEKLKQKIRDEYISKVDDYFPDIIIHTSDNYEQSEFVEKFLFAEIDLNAFFSSLESYGWMIIKSESENYPQDFPKHYPLGKDIDIVCDPGDFDDVCRITEDFFSGIAIDGYSWEARSKNAGQYSIRFQIENTLILQIDIMAHSEYLSDEFIENSIARRERKKGYYIANIKDECLFRLIDYYEKPHKKYHLEFVENHL